MPLFHHAKIQNTQISHNIITTERWSEKYHLTTLQYSRGRHWVQAPVNVFWHIKPTTPQKLLRNGVTVAWSKFPSSHCDCSCWNKSYPLRPNLATNRICCKYPDAAHHPPEVMCLSLQVRAKADPRWGLLGSLFFKQVLWCSARFGSVELCGKVDSLSALSCSSGSSWAVIVGWQLIYFAWNNVWVGFICQRTST